jgi:hypothetical protein
LPAATVFGHLDGTQGIIVFGAWDVSPIPTT